MNYSNFDIDRIIKSMVIQVDTREQITDAYKKRIESMDCPVERVKLDYGDYSASCILPNGNTISMADKVTIERKMSIDELCGCYTKGRKRFEREFMRSADNGAKMYLLIENASWEKVLNGAYRSQFCPNALTASLIAWSIRYNYQIIFCKAETSGKMIQEILKRELKEMLENGEIDEYSGTDKAECRHA